MNRCLGLRRKLARMGKRFHEVNKLMQTTLRTNDRKKGVFIPNREKNGAREPLKVHTRKGDTTK